MAQGIEDLLTFWILDDQSKHILARSVVHPFTNNLRVKWDSALSDMSIRDKDNPDVTETNTVDLTLESIRMPKQKYVNPGLDTTVIEVPRVTGPITRSKGKLKLDNDVMPVDESIETFTRSKQLPYKEVQYKEQYTPPEFKEPDVPLRQSKQLADQSD